MKKENVASVLPENNQPWVIKVKKHNKLRVLCNIQQKCNKLEENSEETPNWSMMKKKKNGWKIQESTLEIYEL